MTKRSQPDPARQLGSLLGTAGNVADTAVRAGATITGGAASGAGSAAETVDLDRDSQRRDLPVV